MGGHRADAVHDQAAAGRRKARRRSTTSTSTNGSSRSRGQSMRGRTSSCCSAVRRGSACGEMMALEWSDIDLANRQLCVARSDWNGHRDDAEGRPPATRAADPTPGRGAQCASAPAERARALPGRRRAAHAQIVQAG